MNLKQEILKDLGEINLRLVRYYKESRYQKKFKPQYRQQEVWIYTHSSDWGHCITESEFRNKPEWKFTKELIIKDAKSATARVNWRKKKQEETAELEAILHPTPKIKGFDILHRHVGHRIIFEAWKGEDRLPKGLSYARRYILKNHESNEEFYSAERHLLINLTYD